MCIKVNKNCYVLLHGDLIQFQFELYKEIQF